MLYGILHGTLQAARDMHVALYAARRCMLQLHVAWYALIGKEWSERGLFAVFAALSLKKPGSLSAVAGGGADDVETTDGRDRRKAREGPVVQHATRNMQHATRDRHQHKLETLPPLHLERQPPTAAAQLR